MKPIPTIARSASLFRALVTLTCLPAAVSISKADFSPPPEEPYSPPASCECEQEDGGDGPDSAACDSTGSVHFSLSLGRTAFERKTDQLRAATTPALNVPLKSMAYRGGKGENAVTSSRQAPQGRSFEETSAFYRQAPLSARRDFKVWIAQENITAATFTPGVLKYDEEALAEKILVGGVIRQILTEDRFADIQPLFDVRLSLPAPIQAVLNHPYSGFVIRAWKAGQQGAMSSGLYTLPATEPTSYVVFYNPDAPIKTSRLNIIHHAKFDNSGTYKTRSYCHHDESLAHGWTSTQYQGLPSPYPVEKVTLISQTWENALKFTQLRTVEQASLIPSGTSGSFGDLQPISKILEEYDDIGGLSRMVKETVGETAGGGQNPARITTYGWYNTPLVPATHGRLMWVCRPDGDFEYYTYSMSESMTIVKRTPWKDYKWDPVATPAGPVAANCINETSIVGLGYIYRTRAVGSTTIGYETESWSTLGDGTRVFTESKQYNSSSSLSTSTGYHPATAGYQANRIKWRELPDGTAETYNYTAPDGSGNYVRTINRGAGNRNGITSGERTVSTINGRGSVILEENYHFHGASSVLLEWWASDHEDEYGRPTKRVWNANPNDFDEPAYNCCGGETFRDRQGTTTVTYRDDLNRVHKRIVTTGARVVTTETGYSGLYTTVRRKAGTLDILVSSTWRLLNGELDKTHAPDENNDATPEVTSYTYSYPGTGGRIVTATLPGGGTEITEYFIDGRVKSVTGTAVSDTLYDYGIHTLSGNGLTTTITRPSAASPTGEWVRTYTDRAGRTFQTEYPGSALNSVSFYSHSAAAGARGKPYQITDPDGVVKTFAYDSEGGRASITEAIPAAGNRVTTFTHAPGTISGLGSGIIDTVSINGVEVEKTERGGTGHASRRTTNQSRATLSVSSVITAPGDWVETTTHPDGTRTVNNYNDGLLQSTEHRDNTGSIGVLISSTSFGHDALGRMIFSTDSRSGTTSFTVNSSGQPVAYNASGAIPAYTESGNLLASRDPGGRATTYSYDHTGRRTLVDQPDTAIQGGGTAANQTRTSYYPTGNVKAVWGDQTYATFHTYDEQGRMSGLRTYRSLGHGIEPLAATAEYDATTWEYHTQRGFLTAKKDAMNLGPSYTYTAAGRLKTRTWARGNRTRYDYRQGFIVATRYFTSAGADTGSNAGNDPDTSDVGHTYDSFGQAVESLTAATASQPATRIGRTYDSVTRRVTRELFQIDPDLTFTLGSVDPGITLVTGTTAPSFERVLHRKADAILRNTGADLRLTSSDTSTLNIGSTLTYGSADGRLTTVTGDFAGTSAAYNYAYKNASFGLVESVTGPAHIVTNAWEADRDVLDWKENKAGTTVISKYDYGVNAIGQRTSVTSTGTAFGTAPDWNWQYNARGELALSQHAVTSATQAYSYDGIGNRTTALGATYAANSLNQYDDIGGYPLWHDEDGNLVVAPNSHDYVWDGENRLKMIVNGNFGWSRYLYDAFGRRVSQAGGNYFSSEEPFPDSYDFSSCGYSVYDGWNLVAEFAGTPHAVGTPPAVTQTMSWLWGHDLSGTLQGAGGVGGLLAAKSATTIAHPLYDGNGNVCQYLNGSGTVIASYEYDGFGNTLAHSGIQPWAFPHRFSTKYQDGSYGLYYYGYRYYDPVTGRWPSREPIGEAGSLNLYSFIDNDGATDFDILGLCSGSRKALLDAACKAQKETEKQGVEFCAAICCKDGKYTQTKWNRGTRLACSVPNCQEGEVKISDLHSHPGVDGSPSGNKPGQPKGPPGDTDRAVADNVGYWIATDAPFSANNDEVWMVKYGRNGALGGWIYNCETGEFKPR